MAWQAGTATLLIPSSLVLEQLATDGCRQSRITALPAPATGESIEIQYYRAGATMDVLLTEQRERLKVDRALMVEVSADAIHGHCGMQFSLSRGQRRVVLAEVNPAWTIDAVEYRNGNGSVDWELEELESKKTLLRINLDAPVSPTNPAQLIVRGHRARPAGAAFDASHLSMFGAGDSLPGANLISVRAAEGFELHWTREDELSRADPLQLDPAELQLFPKPPQAPVFTADAMFDQATLALQRRKPSYAVDIRIDAAVHQDLLTETYTIQCVPESARVDRLLICLSQSREPALEWNLAGASSGQFAARRLSVAEQAQAGLPAGGETWELVLKLARSGPFELRAIRSVAFRQETPVALASVADATTQRGTLMVRALGDSGLAIKNRRLMSVPAELLEADRYQTVRATYHYQPARDDMGTEPAVSIAPAKPIEAESGAWAWNHRLVSRFAADGTCVHWAALHIQTGGRQRIHVSLPPDAQLQGAWVDQQQLPLAPAPRPADSLTIDLPSGRSFAAIALHYSTPARLPRYFATHEPCFATVDLPVISRQWSVWLPPGYEIVDTNPFSTRLMPSPTWTERVFGLLGRGADARVFNPLAASDWRRLLAGSSDRRALYTACEQFANHLGKHVAESVDREELTWGQLLALCADTEAQGHRAVFIDGDGLRWLGLAPHTRVDPGEPVLDRGVGVLERANLVLIAAPGAMLVTSSIGAASYASQLTRLEGRIMYAVGQGPLADDLQSAGQAGRGGNFVSLDEWRAAPQLSQSPWPESAAAPLNLNAAVGWQTYTLQSSEDSMPGARIVHGAATRSLAWALFLGIVGLGLWPHRLPAFVLVLLVAVAAAVSLLLPPTYLPLSSAVTLASLLCLIVRMIRVPEPPELTKEPSRGSYKLRSSVVRTGTLALFVAALMHFVAAIQASPPVDAQSKGARLVEPTKGSDGVAPTGAAPATQPAEGQAKAGQRNKPLTAPALYEVFVPNDSEGPPADQKCYVPRELYNQLYRQAAVASKVPKDWLIARPVYQGSLSRDPISKQLGISRLTASFDVHVFQANARVRLPLSRETDTQPIVGAHLDGRTTPLTWSVAGDELILEAMPVGQYRLELDLKPVIQTDLTTAGFDLAIPPLADALLELAFPPDSPNIELPTARGQIRVFKDRLRLSAQLGASRRLAVRWPAGVGAEGAATNLEVEELLWVKVRPGTTVIDIKFKYHQVAGRIGRVRLLTDPRLRLLPATGAPSPITAVHTVPGNPQKIDLEFASSTPDHVDIELSFLLTGTSGVGNVQLPRLETSGIRATRRWLAVSVDPALQYKEQGEDAKPLEIADYLAAWGAADSRPQAAYTIQRGEPMWHVATQPNEPQTSVDQTLAVSLGRSASRVRYEALLTISRGYIFRLGLQTSPGLLVERVSVLEDDVQRVARWSSDENGRITVFLLAPIKGRQRLTLEGRVDVNGLGNFVLPQLRMTDAELKKNHLQVYRQPGVRVEVLPTNHVTEIDTADVEKRADERREFGAPVGRYAIENSQATCSVVLTPNTPRLRTATATYLQRDADRWMAEMECHVEVLEGLADTLQFDIPPQWSEPYRLDPAVEFAVVPIPGEQRRRMIVYPTKPIDGEYQLKLRGRVALIAGDRLSVPDILPRHIQQVDRFVVLPQYLDLQQVTWDTQGLTRSTLPLEFAVRNGSAQSSTVFQATAERFQASLKAVQRAGATARVKMADIHLVWQSDGNCQCVAAFDVEPGGAGSIVLELPPGGRLLHVTVESLPAQVTTLETNRWRLGLGPRRLPQRVEVICTSRTSGSGGSRRFHAPRLVDLAVEQTLWSIYGSPEFGPGRRQVSGGGSGATTAAQQELNRLQCLANLVQLPPDVIGEHLPEEIGRWYRPWRMRFAASRAALVAGLATARKNAARSDEAFDLTELDKQVAAIDVQLGYANLDSRQSSPSISSADLLAGARANSAVASFSTQGALYDPEVRYPRAVSGSAAGRLATAVALILFGCPLAYAVRGRPLPKLAPWFVIGAIGLFWWLLLAPSAIGLIAWLAACGGALREKRRLAGEFGRA